MPRPAFLNDNEARAYPLIPAVPAMQRAGSPVALPYATLVDFGCIMGLDAGYNDRTHAVHLHSVQRAGTEFTFEFRCDAPGLWLYALRFTRRLADPEFATDESEAVLQTTPGQVDPCVAIRDDPLWEGWLTTGLLDDLEALLADGQSLLADVTAPVVEPATIQNLALGYVRTLNLANEDRTRALAPEGCSEGDSVSLGDPVSLAQQYRTIINAECLFGPQTLREGYNCVIRQSAQDNALTISAALAAGAGAPCDEVPLAARETPPPGSKLLTGGPACDEIITSINGLSGSVITLVPLHGVQVTVADTAPNTLIVDVDLHDLAICPVLSQSSEILPVEPE
jgi:hypothetical protein